MTFGIQRKGLSLLAILPLVMGFSSASVFADKNAPRTDEVVADIKSGESVSTAYTRTASANMNVTLQLAAACTISAQDLNFGQVDRVKDKITQGSTIAVTCSEGTPYSLGLVAKSNNGKLVHESDSTSTIPYTLYTDEGALSEWKVGDYFQGKDATSSGNVHKVFAQVLGEELKDKPNGKYQESLTFHINY